MSSQSNRNWASTTPGKFLSSLLYLRSKPLVFLQALLNVQLLWNVWEGLGFVCHGLSVREQVPDSRRPHKQHLANCHLKLSLPGAPLSSGSVTPEVGSPWAQPPAGPLQRLWLWTTSHGAPHTSFGAQLLYTQQKACLRAYAAGPATPLHPSGSKVQPCAEGNITTQRKKIAKVSSHGYLTKRSSKRMPRSIQAVKTQTWIINISSVLHLKQSDWINFLDRAEQGQKCHKTI